MPVLSPAPSTATAQMAPSRPRYRCVPQARTHPSQTPNHRTTASSVLLDRTAMAPRMPEALRQAPRLVHRDITAHPGPSTLTSSRAVLATTTIKLDRVRSMTASTADSTNTVRVTACRQRAHVRLALLTLNLRQPHTAHLALQATRASRTPPSSTQYLARRASTQRRGHHIARTAR